VLDKCPSDERTAIRLGTVFSYAVLEADICGDRKAALALVRSAARSGAAAAVGPNAQEVSTTTASKTFTLCRLVHAACHTLLRGAHAHGTQRCPLLLMNTLGVHAQPPTHSASAESADLACTHSPPITTTTDHQLPTTTTTTSVTATQHEEGCKRIDELLAEAETRWSAPLVVPSSDTERTPVATSAYDSSGWLRGPDPTTLRAATAASPAAQAPTGGDPSSLSDATAHEPER
jgi:hypothetical protein